MKNAVPASSSVFHFRESEPIVPSSEAHRRRPIFRSTSAGFPFDSDTKRDERGTTVSKLRPI